MGQVNVIGQVKDNNFVQLVDDVLVDKNNDPILVVTDAALAAKYAVQQDPITLELKVGGTTISVATSYTLVQFLLLVVGDYANRTIEISDIPTPHSSANGVLVRANAAGTGWIWIETPSLTMAQIAANSITAAMASGWRIFVSDMGPGCYLYSDGTRFRIAQPSTIVDAMATQQVLTGRPIVAKLGKQVAIPRVGGKSILGVGDIMKITSYYEKTGTADVAHIGTFVGSNVLAVDDTDTNTQITTYGSTTTAVGITVVRTILRRADAAGVSVLRSLGSDGVPASGGAGGSRSSDISLAISLDSADAYVDTTLRFVITGDTDTNLTLVSNIVEIVPAGAA